jgi:hypothetical protein
VASENWHDHENAFGYRHEVQPQKVAGGAFAFVGFVVAGVYLLVRRYSKRRAASRPAPLTPSQLSAMIVGEAVQAARIDYVERTNAVPSPRVWDSLK